MFQIAAAAAASLCCIHFPFGQAAKALSAPATAVAIPPVFAEPDTVLPGQQVTFHFPPDARKIVAAGGGFGQRTVIWSGQDVTDTPTERTAYVFRIWSEPENPILASAGVPLHTIFHRYQITVDVYKGSFPPLATYHDTRGWRLDIVSGWNRYSVPNVDPLNNALIYFQKQPDDTNRAVVAITPVDRGTSPEDLMRQVQEDAPNQYNVFQDFKIWPTQQGGRQAAMASFQGIDQSRPDVTTESLILAFISHGRGYVISARTREADFTRDLPLLHAIIRSFEFENPVKPSRKA
ncbi:MAG TPA: hypothetical protein VGS41_06470 [Chthonomonadales bacterium]|nr:hypothetical protein [Chthonomonadales bacterium]